LLVGLAAFFIPLLMPGVLNDPDSYWHIAAGRWMFEHGQVPSHDPFSFSLPGAAWMAHEWGSELLLAWLYQLAGWPGLSLLVAGSFAVTLAYLMRFLLARMEPVHAILAVGIVALMMMPALLARPHVVVWPLTALWIGTLVRSNEARRAPPWWLLAVLLVWTNLHASFVVGLGLALALGADAVACAPPPTRWPLARAWALFLVAAGGCVLINPHGYGVILYTFDVMHLKTELALIQEWQAPNFQQPQPLALWLLLVIALAFAGRVRLPLVRSAVVLGLLVMSLQHQRYVALLGLLSPFIMAEPLARQWRAQAAAGRDAEALDRWFRALAAPARLATAGVAWLLAATVALGVERLKPPEPPADDTPRVAVAALLSTGAGSRILNAYNFGGYLIFRRVPVFIDGRGDMYGDAFVSSYFKALTLTGVPGALEAMLAKYNIDSTLLPPKTPAVQMLDHLPGWRRVYADKVAVVHVRQLLRSGEALGISVR
jgi:hypothetical protein